MSELVAFKYILSTAKFLLCIAMDDGTFGFVLSSSGFKVKSDNRINECFALFWLLEMHYLNLAAWLD